MSKKELQAEFNMVKGFSNFLALVTSSPNANLADLHIAQYEVAPTELFHMDTQASQSALNLPLTLLGVKRW